VRHYESAGAGGWGFDAGDDAVSVRRWVGLGVAGASLVVGALVRTPPRVQAAQAPVTWRRQVAPILYKNCTTCHHAGGSGPFALMTFAEARRWGSQMEQVTATRYMPPWLPEEHERFQDERRLSQEEIALIKQWVAAGMPEGEGAVPAAPVYANDWQMGKPDLVLEMNSTMVVPAGGPDLFMNFVLPVKIAGTKWVRAMEIKPGSPTLVHHANVIVDRTASFRRAHPADWQRGVPGMDILVDSGDSFDPDSHFLFWKPDSTALVEPAGMPWRLDAGNDLILNMHLKPTGKTEMVKARIALYFADKPATQLPMLVQLEHDDALDIPAGDASFVVEDQLTLPVAVEVLGVYPHAHYLGKHLEGWAELPNGQRRWLVEIKDWDIDRQSVYRFVKPVDLPKGSVVRMRYTYDNSAGNVRNPNAPPIEVRAGNRSADEMGHLWLQVLPKPEAGVDGREALEQAWMESRLRKDPRDGLALYNLASLEMMQGDAAKAAGLYAQVLAERPGDVRALTSAGSALAAAGDWAGAQARLREAVAKEPEDVDAAFDLAGVDLEHDDVAEAQGLLLRLSAAHPDDAGVQRLLAMSYAQQGDAEKALAPLAAWERLAPKEADPHRALAQVYSQLGRGMEAVREQQVVIGLLPQSAMDWNDLGMLEARAGDLVGARRALEHGLAIEPQNATLQANLAKVLKAL
jgi:Flp pilus assembly protein TadD